MRRCAVLLHPDADYAGRLADFWNQRKSLGLPVYAFSALEAFRAFRARADVELLLFSEHFADEMQGLLGQSMAILLSEDGFVSERCQNALPVPAVFSYRPADALARRVMQLYATARPGALSRFSAATAKFWGSTPLSTAAAKPPSPSPSDSHAPHRARPCFSRSKTTPASMRKLRRMPPKVSRNFYLPTAAVATAGPFYRADSPPSARWICCRRCALRKICLCSPRRNSLPSYSASRGRAATAAWY